jgi:hypothetical protein
MVYRINFVALEEDSFLLRHLCDGSAEFCRLHGIKTAGHHGSDWQVIYIPWLETTIWDRLFYLAARLRTAFDISDPDRRHGLDAIDFESLNPVSVSDGARLNLWRQVFDKIVHADTHHFLWEWKNRRRETVPHSHPDATHCEWEGRINIQGPGRDGSGWHYILDCRRLTDGCGHVDRALAAKGSRTALD